MTGQTAVWKHAWETTAAGIQALGHRAAGTSRHQQLSLLSHSNVIFEAFIVKKIYSVNYYARKLVVLKYLYSV